MIKNPPALHCMKYTNVIISLIIHYFKQISSPRETNTKKFLFIALVIDWTVVARSIKSMINIGFRDIMSKSRFFKLNQHDTI